MLSILPYERAAAASSQSHPHRHSDRPFKSYPRSTLASAPPTAHNSSYLSAFGHSGIIGSLHPIHQVNHHLKQDAPMDLRPQASMYDGRDSYEHHAAAPYMDLSAQFAHRIPNIKTEEQGHVNPLYPQVNTNPAHSNGYSPNLVNMPSLRDMSPPTQASLPGLNGAVSSSSSATTPPDMRSLDTRPGNGTGVFTSSLGATTNPSSSHAPHTTTPPHVLSPHSNPSSSSNGNNHSDSDDERHGQKRPLTTVPEEMKDTAYWEKRKKNNDSAKRSREARRIKEEQIAMRVVYLEQDNLQLRTEVSLLKSEIEKLRCMLYNS